MDFKGLIKYFISGFIIPVTTLMLAAAIVYFLWNIFQVVKNAGDEKELEKFKQKAVWGIIAIAVMVSMWGLVNFVTDTANLNNSPITIPALPGA